MLYNSIEVDDLVDSDIPPMADGVYVVGRGIVGETIKGYYTPAVPQWILCWQVHLSGSQDR